MSTAPRPRVIVAMSGASGSVYGITALRLLREHGGYETHLVMSPAAIRTLYEETDLGVDDVTALADVTHRYRDIGSSIASGSFRVHGMLIAPCSVRTLGALAVSLGDNSIVRAADVCLKERRRVVLLLRETPLHAGQIELMAQVTRAGAIVMPPVPAFYPRPRSLEDVLTHTAARALDLLEIEVGGIARWNGARNSLPQAARNTVP